MSLCAPVEYFGLCSAGVAPAQQVVELDFVLETGERLLPIEVKATARPRLADATKLRSFRAEYGKLSRAGLLLHTGTQLEWITPDVLAAPWWTVC